MKNKPTMIDDLVKALWSHNPDLTFGEINLMARLLIPKIENAATLMRIRGALRNALQLIREDHDHESMSDGAKTVCQKLEVALAEIEGAKS